MLRTLDVSASALEAERVRMNVIAHNLANANTTRATRRADGSFEPYRRRLVTFAARPMERGRDRLHVGVRATSIIEDLGPFRMEWDPSHPDADADGNVFLPNVDPIVEQVDMLEASRAYEANITAMEVTKSLMAQTGRIIA